MDVPEVWANAKIAEFVSECFEVANSMVAAC